MSDTTNIFERASRAAIRFASTKGALTTEQLWDLPLTSKTGFDLDNVAKIANAELKAMTEESFVATRSNPAKASAELKLDVVKHIIAARLEENEKARAAASNAALKERLTSALADKEDEELKKLSPEQLRAQIAALNTRKDAP